MLFWLLFLFDNCCICFNCSWFFWFARSSSWIKELTCSSFLSKRVLVWLRFLRRVSGSCTLGIGVSLNASRSSFGAYFGPYDSVISNDSLYNSWIIVLVRCWIFGKVSFFGWGILPFLSQLEYLWAGLPQIVQICVLSSTK